MNKILASRSFVSIKLTGVQEDNPDMLKGVVMCEVGEVHPAEGPAFYLDEKFLQDLVKLCADRTLKVRVNHPGEQGEDVMAMVGQAMKFRVDGNKVRGDIELFDVPEKSRLQEYAKKAAEHFGMSLVMLIELTKEKVGDLKTAVLKAVDAVDFVGKGAATKSLFCSGVDSRTSYMNLTLSEKALAALGLDPKKADEKSTEAAILNMCAEHADMKTKMATKAEETPEEKQKREDEKKKAKAGEDEKKEEEKLAAARKEMATKLGIDESQITVTKAAKKGDESNVIRMTKAEMEEIGAQAATRILASHGIKPKASAADGKDGQPAKMQLTEAQKADCVKLGITEDEAIKNLERFKVAV